MPFLRKYNTLLVTGTTAIGIPIIKRGVVDYAASGDWTPAAGDVKVWTDGTPANITNLPTAINSGNCTHWEFILTAAELSGKTIRVTITDSATKAVEDQHFIIETFGHASAMYVADFSLANLPANVVQLLGTAWLPPAVAGTPDVNAKQLGGSTQSATDLKDFADDGYDPSTNKVQGVVLTDTVTTYTGNTPQTGDAYAVVNSGTFGNAAIKTQTGAIETDTQDIQSRLPAALTGDGNIKADALRVGGTTQTGADVGGLVATVGAAGAGLTAADDDVIAAIAALNNLSSAQAQTAAAAALTSYDPPTRTEATSDKDEILTATTAIQADLPQRITKNTALSGFTFLMVEDGDHVTPATGLTVTATRSLDGAAFGACANAVSEISNGFYKIDLAAGDLNGNVVALKFSATGADQRSMTLVTQPT
jgi:hypothetical protein